MPTPGATTDTVAFSVTVWPTTGAAGVTASTVLVVSEPTDTLTPADVDVASVALPEYTAVTEPGPAVVKGTRSEPTPLARVAVPSTVEPT